MTPHNLEMKRNVLEMKRHNLETNRHLLGLVRLLFLVLVTQLLPEAVHHPLEIGHLA
jgi:hypothetical protein